VRYFAPRAPVPADMFPRYRNVPYDREMRAEARREGRARVAKEAIAQRGDRAMFDGLRTAIRGPYDLRSYPRDACNGLTVTAA